MIRLPSFLDLSKILLTVGFAVLLLSSSIEYGMAAWWPFYKCDVANPAPCGNDPQPNCLCVSQNVYPRCKLTWNPFDFCQEIGFNCVGACAENGVPCFFVKGDACK